MKKAKCPVMNSKISKLECAYIHLPFTVDEDVEPPRPRPKPTTSTTTSTMSPTSISMFN